MTSSPPLEIRWDHERKLKSSRPIGYVLFAQWVTESSSKGTTFSDVIDKIDDHAKKHHGLANGFDDLINQGYVEGQPPNPLIVPVRHTVADIRTQTEGAVKVDNYAEVFLGVPNKSISPPTSATGDGD